MSDPNLAPNDTVSNIEGATSTSPIQGVGAHIRSRDPSFEVIKRGRVDDIYMSKFCAVVSLYGYRSGVPCLWGSDSANRWGGARTIAPPSVGSDVAVILSLDGKYGYIVGVYPSTSSKAPSLSAFASSVFHGSENEAHAAKEFGFDSHLIAAAAGTPNDALPGDHMIINGAGAMMAVLELAVIVGSGSASFESFVLDRLVRSTGWNSQERNSLMDKSTMEDWGKITEEEFGSHLVGESMGNDPELEVPESVATAARRFLNLRGHLGGLVQRWIMRPNQSPSDMSKADEQPDIGLFHQLESLSGFFATRSVVGGGILKVPAIPVPKRKHSADDPQGDAEKFEDAPAEPFKFSSVPETPVSASCQLRDFIAWLFNKQAMHRLGERKADWHLPDEATCAAVAETLKAPGLGEFFRNFPDEVDAMSDGTEDGLTEDKSEVMKTRPGLAWILTLPNGGVSIRDIWGSQVEMSGGHIDISASKDVRITAGRNLVLMGGDDVVIKGRNSVDITSTLKQVRIKSQGDLFIHSEEGGMLISLGSLGRQFRGDAQGEEVGLPGICIKAPGGVIIDAEQLTANLSKTLLVTGREEGAYPQFVGRFSDAKWDTPSGMSFRFSGDQFVNMSGGSIFLSQNVQAEGSAFFKGGGVFGSEPTFPGDWSSTPSLAELVAPVFEGLDQMQYPYSLDELQQVAFGFRTDEQYSVRGGKWFEFPWQRELDGLDEWEEKPAKDGSYPYPGKENYTDSKNWWSYEESNVEMGGRSKRRDSLSANPDGFIAGNWNSIKVHPQST